MAQAYGNSTQLTTKLAARAGVNIATLQTPDGTNGNKFLNNGRVMFRAKNGSASPITVTFDTPGTIDGLAVANLDVVIPATTGDVLIGPFTGNFNQPGTQDVFVSYSAVTTLTVDVYQIPNE